MRRERISEDIYIFTSELYAQVTACAILTDEGAIVIDTLPFPAESRDMADFIHRRPPGHVRFVINTHFHADHVYGNYLYPEAQIIGHQLCRDALMSISEEQMERARVETPALEEVVIVPPSIVFENEMGLHLAERSLRLLHLPGHSPDGIGVFVDGEGILFAGDAVMPVPYFGAGDHGLLRRTLQRVLELNPDHIVQGHGETLLRGEIEETLVRHMDYIDCVEERVETIVERGGSASDLQEIQIEDCGESAIPLDGLVRQLHQANMLKLYNLRVDGS
jgi:cyclase